MIELPKRSVTRFFIPLIDVLILLFCIYLLMPIIKEPADTTAVAFGEGATPGPASGQDKQELQRLQKEFRELQARTALTDADRSELKLLKREKELPLERRLAIRVLEIDGASGKLFQYDPERVEISNESVARTTIARDKRQAAGRELYYLFLLPRRLTGYPLERQVEQYRRWFSDVPHGFNNPSGAT